MKSDNLKRRTSRHIYSKFSIYSEKKKKNQQQIKDKTRTKFQKKYILLSFISVQGKTFNLSFQANKIRAKYRSLKSLRTKDWKTEIKYSWPKLSPTRAF